MALISFSSESTLKHSTKYIEKDPSCMGFEPVAITNVSVYLKISILIIHKKYT